MTGGKKKLVQAEVVLTLGEMVLERFPCFKTSFDSPLSTARFLTRGDGRSDQRLQRRFDIALTLSHPVDSTHLDFNIVSAARGRPSASWHLLESGLSTFADCTASTLRGSSLHVSSALVSCLLACLPARLPFQRRRAWMDAHSYGACVTVLLAAMQADLPFSVCVPSSLARLHIVSPTRKIACSGAGAHLRLAKLSLLLLSPCFLPPSGLCSPQPAAFSIRLCVPAPVEIVHRSPGPAGVRTEIAKIRNGTGKEKKYSRARKLLQTNGATQRPKLLPFFDESRPSLTEGGTAGLAAPEQGAVS